MATWEITITCQDGSRLRFSELRGHAPKKGEIIETADAGKIIKAKIDAHREERQAGGSRSPFSQVSGIEAASFGSFCDRQSPADCPRSKAQAAAARVAGLQEFVSIGRVGTAM